VQEYWEKKIDTKEQQRKEQPGMEHREHGVRNDLRMGDEVKNPQGD